MLGLILIVFLLLFFVGGAVPGPWYGQRRVPGQPVTPAPAYWHGYGGGPYVPGGIGLVLLILIVLLVMGRI
jgi:hypothetical protein